MNLGSPRGFGTPVPPLPTSLGSRWLPVRSRHGHSVTMTTRTTVPTHFLEATEPKGRPRSGSSVPERRRDAADGSVVSGRRREACAAGRRLPGHTAHGLTSAEYMPAQSQQAPADRSRGPSGAWHRASGRAVRLFLQSEQTETPIRADKTKVASRSPIRLVYPPTWKSHLLTK